MILFISVDVMMFVYFFHQDVQKALANLGIQVRGLMTCNLIILSNICSLKADNFLNFSPLLFAGGITVPGHEPCLPLIAWLLSTAKDSLKNPNST